MASALISFQRILKRAQGEHYPGTCQGAKILLRAVDLITHQAGKDTDCSRMSPGIVYSDTFRLFRRDTRGVRLEVAGPDNYGDLWCLLNIAYPIGLFTPACEYVIDVVGFVMLEHFQDCLTRHSTFATPVNRVSAK